MIHLEYDKIKIRMRNKQKLIKEKSEKDEHNYVLPKKKGMWRANILF